MGISQEGSECVALAVPERAGQWPMLAMGGWASQPA